MCGIIGYIGHREAAPVLLQGLKRLEYRGYDSAGVAVFANGGSNDGILVRRSVGKLTNLDRLLQESPVRGSVGMGHTRWATHGRPSEENAHPHRAGKVVVIHNGIIENYLALRHELQAKGRKFSSETDTEVISHLIDEYIQHGMTFTEATRAALQRLEGAFSIVVLCESEPDKILAAKNATPIVIGLGEGENFIASDIPALLDYTRKVTFLDDGEMAEVTCEQVKLSDFHGVPIEREPRMITWDTITAQKGGYKHFLLKEIHEQPQAIIDTMRGRILPEESEVSLGEFDEHGRLLNSIRRLTLVACGTAWHACLAGKFYLEELARIPAEVDYGSEFRYRKSPLEPYTAVLAVSQSGETADTLAALEGGKELGLPTLAICNVVDSSIPRKSDIVLYTHAGPEISVASTKAFTTQLTALYLLAVYLGRRRGVINKEQGRQLIADLVNLPAQVREILSKEKAIEKIAKKYGQAKDFLYLGRGVNYPIALEGALKLKEISYIHAEGYPAGEMKHGPIALIDEEMPVVVLLPKDPVYAKTLSNMKEVEARGGRIIAITDAPSQELEDIAWEVIQVPPTNHLLMPILLTIPMQLLAYHIAVYRGTDVDQPRNLAKSVTVE
ncbi:MAG TPA: glutamine--fructose-6-phosphate transaminase (isomerizing) [Methylomirabilota bacterium]|jgi:glucosamine--fructose-6-phosphate aminotransferase (isomerizing)|nr:glutamine--fructose-6-phosphate transaminase (isomerizing) [Methylomirabilota bacterium]